MSNQPVYVLGVGLTKFIKPRGKVDYPEMGYEAGVKAMLDAGITYDDVNLGVACYAYGDSTCGQRVFYQFGMTQIPIYNQNNNCATGSTGIHLARTLLSTSPILNVALVVGFEKMAPGSLKSNFPSHTSPVDKLSRMMFETNGVDMKAPGAAQFFGNAGREYMKLYGATKEDLAEVARVGHAHSVKNPYSQFQDIYTLEQILSSPTVFDPLTKLQCCPTSDGAAAAVLVTQRFLDAHPSLKSRAVLIAGQGMTTDAPSAFSRSAIDLIGYDMTTRAAAIAYQEANYDPAANPPSNSSPVIVELHDCFSANVLPTLDALKLTPKRGTAHHLYRSGEATYGPKSRMVVNPSGGLISKGHPLGATGIGQCAELVWQLRGWANNRLVEGAEVAVQHNLGLGGAGVVTVYKRADGGRARKVSDEEVKMVVGMEYNPAVEARTGVSEEMRKRVCSRDRFVEYMHQQKRGEERAAL
ncbi:sterol carrier protein 2 [Kalaharituber pfeilii]|nr:sterol carrier protein 2 [Kalaharituber pfeilii]